VSRAGGLSVRLKLTLSYAGFLLLAAVLMLAAAWFAGRPDWRFDVLLSYVPDRVINAAGWLVPGTSAYLLRAYAPAAAVALLFLLMFGLAGGWLLAGRMLVPLTRITEAARLAASGSLSHRINLSGRRDEFRELADVFDTMLSRLDAHVTEQRRFAANASHELRTPLAVTRTLLEVARNDPDRDVPQLLARLEAVNTRAIDLTEALLLLSRADQRAVEHEVVDLSLLAEEAAETLLPLAEARTVTIETAGEVARASGSPALLLQMTTNLVHNAIVHNLPAGGWVHVTTRCAPGRAELSVENSGEALAPERAATLVEPFQRGGGRARSEHAGVGLGLAIVRSIVQAHDGGIEVAARADGGLRVVVVLPGVPEA
jgi:two-component system sensor histidine kinase VanS